MVILRRVNRADCQQIWEWANDPKVRSTAFYTEPISWHLHKSWFDKKLQDPYCHFFIAEDENGNPIGQVRFDTVKSVEAIIDISIDNNLRGLGYGTLLLVKGVEEIFGNSSIVLIHAYVKDTNIESSRSFEKAGFIYTGEETIQGFQAKHFLRKKTDE